MLPSHNTLGPLRKKFHFRAPKVGLAFTLYKFSRSRTEATSASTTNRVVPIRQRHQSGGLTKIWGLEGKPGASVKQRRAPARTSHASSGCLQAPPGRRQAELNARARGQRGRPPRERAVIGARGRGSAGALRRRRLRALQDEAVRAGKRARRRRRLRAEGTRGPRAAGADGCGGDPGLAARGGRARPVDCLLQGPLAASLARSGRRPRRLAVTRA